MLFLIDSGRRPEKRFLDPINNDYRETLGSFVLVSDFLIGLEGDRDVSCLAIQA